MEPPTLEELVKEARIPLTSLDKECSDEHIKSISLFLDWRSVAPHLGLSETEIQEIDFDKRQESEKRLQTLQKWKKIYSFKATYRKLVEILLVVKDAAAALKVCQLLQPQVHEGSSSDSEASIATQGPTRQLSSTATTPSDQSCDNPVMTAEPGEQPEAPSTTVEVANITTELCKQKIEDEIQELEEQFFNVVCKAQCDLEKIELSMVILRITQLPVSVKHQHIKFLKENHSEITSAKNVREIFSILGLYWDFLNCGLLNEIVHKLGTNETKQLMEEYTEELRKFRMNTKLEDFIAKWTRSPPPYFLEFITKMEGDWRNYTLEDLEKFRIKLAGTMYVEEYALRYARIKPGSISVTWAVPSFLPEIIDTLQSIFPKLEEEYDVFMVVFQGKYIPVHVTEKDRRQRALELHQRRERKLLQELQKQEPKPKQRRPRQQEKQEPSQEPQGSVITSQGTLPFRDLLFDTKCGGFIARSDCMFIASVGSEHPASVKVEHKPSDTIRAQRALKTHSRLPHTVTRLPQGTEVDVIVVSCLTRNDSRKELVSLNLDLPGRERSRDYYLQEIEKLMKESKKPAAIIWYTGHSEQGTGNWCFKDGTISFQDIFNLYRVHFNGRLLGIVSDCCYSGNWIDICAQMLDNMGIPPCGHKAREQGVMIKIYASCKPDQKAGDPCYSADGVEFSDKDQCTYFLNKQLTENQTSIRGDFTKLMCCKGPDDACPAESVFRNWKWVDAVSGKMRSNWYNIVNATDRGRPDWYHIILSRGDEEYVFGFKALLTSGYIMNISDWGYVVASGRGEGHSQSIMDKINAWTAVS